MNNNKHKGYKTEIARVITKSDFLQNNQNLLKLTPTMVINSSDTILIGEIFCDPTIMHFQIVSLTYC